jgi:hypothetical protein
MAKYWMITKGILVLFWVGTGTVQECRKELCMPHHAVDAKGREVVIGISLLEIFTPAVPY